MDLEIGVVGVGLARQQRLQLAPRHLGLELFQCRLRFGNHSGVVLGLAEVDHADMILYLALDAAESGK